MSKIEQINIGHRPNSISEVVKDPYFIEAVKSNLRELTSARTMRKPAKEGYRYKRDWYDRMRNNDTLTAKFFLDNIEAIWLKKSSLSSQDRSVIQFVCDNSLREILERYSKQAEKQSTIEK